MITIREIAAEAGVSMMTVSNVINNNTSKVSPETAARVRSIIEKRHYVPNMAARSLVSQTSKIIVLLLPQWNDDGGSLLLDPYTGQIVGTLEETLRKNGYAVMLCSFTNVEQVLALQRKWQVEGSILVLPHKDNITRELVQKCLSPLVVIDSSFDDLDMLTLKIDDHRGGYLATKHLLECGHRKIGFACPTLESNVIAARYCGYCDALKEAGAELREDWVFKNSTHLQGGEELGHLLCAMEDRPTAIVASEDLIACGIIKAMEAHGMPMPQSMSLVGFDDALPARLISPALTTIRQDVDRKANIALELLMEAIDSKKLKNKMVTMDVELIKRDSVARLM